MAQPFAARAGLVLSAVAAALLVWLVTVRSLGIDLVVAVPSGLPAEDPPGRELVGPAQVGMVAGGAGLLAWVFVAVLERVTRRAPVVWLSCALPALILSLAGPLTATTAAGMVSLAGMHLAVGVVLVPGLALIPDARRDRPDFPDMSSACAAGPTIMARRPT